MAKTKPVSQTISEHTNELLTRLNDLKKYYGDKIIKDESFWNLLEIAVKFHDTGKVHTCFQNKLRKILGEPPVKKVNIEEVPHNYLSVALIPFRELGLSREEMLLLVGAVGFHHERDLNPLRELIEQTYEIDIQQYVEELFQHMSFDIPFNKPHKKALEILEKFRTISYAERLSPGSDLWSQFVLLKGLLHRLDHAASAGVVIEDGIEESAGKKTRQFLNQYPSLRPAQKFADDHQDQHVILVSSTGSGKTEAGLLWIAQDKGFFTLPLRVSLNAMYDRIKKHIKLNSVGLLHSGSYDHLVSSEYQDAEQSYHHSKQLASKLTFSTIDQILKFPFLYRGYEKELATMSYSKVVIDEIQAYDPEIAAMLVKAIELIHQLGGKVMVMTATLPTIYLERIQERIGTESIVVGKFPNDNLIRHRIDIRHQSILDLVDEITERSKQEKVLVIANTVNQANILYEQIEQKSQAKPHLLHTLFTLEDRRLLENEVLKFAAIDRHQKRDHSSTNEPGVWITTQIVEASLDIDFDHIYTESSTLDSLFQRMGRCYRLRPIQQNSANVTIATKDCSGIGPIYDAEIHKRSNEYLSEYQGQALKESDKMNLVEKLYSKTVLQGTEFLKVFEKALDEFDRKLPFEETKDDAQKRLRKIESIQVIPDLLYYQIQPLIDRYKQTEDRLERQNIRRQIENKSIVLPVYRLKKEYKISNVPDLKQIGLQHLHIIYGVEYEFNPKQKHGKGLILSKSDPLFL